MQLDDARLIPLQPVGAGRIARFDGVVCLVGDDPTRVSTAALFDACRTHRGVLHSCIQPTILLLRLPQRPLHAAATRIVFQSVACRRDCRVARLCDLLDRLFVGLHFR